MTTDTPAPRFTETEHEKQVALSRALSFMNDPQFIEGDRIIARCYMNALADLASLPTRDDIAFALHCYRWNSFHHVKFAGTFEELNEGLKHRLRLQADALIAAGVRVRA